MVFFTVDHFCVLIASRCPCVSSLVLAIGWRRQAKDALLLLLDRSPCLWAPRTSMNHSIFSNGPWSRQSIPAGPLDDSMIQSELFTGGNCCISHNNAMQHNASSAFCSSYKSVMTIETRKQVADHFAVRGAKISWKPQISTPSCKCRSDDVACRPLVLSFQSLFLVHIDLAAVPRLLAF